MRLKIKIPPYAQFLGFIISIPFISMGMNAIMFGEKLYEDWRIWTYSFPLFIMLGFISWYLHFLYSEYIRSLYPELTQAAKRIIFLALVFVLVMAPSVLIILFLYDYFSILGYTIKDGHLKYALILGFSVNIIFETLWEVLYIIKKYKENLAETEILQQMNLNQEFENLKSQVNPHFLFNCFNTLSSLITENKKEAEHFLDELSKVYRYLLRSNVEGIATLDAEIKFINSYYRLLKTRHGEALHLYTEIDKKYLQYLLPSLSIQLLVENAVKHNVVSRQQPLVIEIFTTKAGQLVVNNNFQPKYKKESSTKIGLNNIRRKYNLMQQSGFQVVEGEKHFMVVLPLVWNKALIQQNYLTHTNQKS